MSYKRKLSPSSKENFQWTGENPPKLARYQTHSNTSILDTCAIVDTSDKLETIYTRIKEETALLKNQSKNLIKDIDIVIKAKSRFIAQLKTFKRSSSGFNRSRTFIKLIQICKHLLKFKNPTEHDQYHAATICMQASQSTSHRAHSDIERAAFSYLDDLTRVLTKRCILHANHVIYCWPFRADKFIYLAHINNCYMLILNDVIRDIVTDALIDDISGDGSFSDHGHRLPHIKNSICVNVDTFSDTHESRQLHKSSVWYRQLMVLQNKKYNELLLANPIKVSTKCIVPVLFNKSKINPIMLLKCSKNRQIRTKRHLNNSSFTKRRNTSKRLGKDKASCIYNCYTEAQSIDREAHMSRQTPIRHSLPIFRFSPHITPLIDLMFPVYNDNDGLLTFKKERVSINWHLHDTILKRESFMYACMCEIKHFALPFICRLFKQFDIRNAFNFVFQFEAYIPMHLMHTDECTIGARNQFSYPICMFSMISSQLASNNCPYTCDFVSGLTEYPLETRHLFDSAFKTIMSSVKFNQATQAMVQYIMAEKNMSLMIKLLKPCFELLDSALISYLLGFPLNEKIIVSIVENLTQFLGHRDRIKQNTVSQYFHKQKQLKRCTSRYKSPSFINSTDPIFFKKVFQTVNATKIASLLDFFYDGFSNHFLKTFFCSHHTILAFCSQRKLKRFYKNEMYQKCPRFTRVMHANILRSIVYKIRESCVQLNHPVCYTNSPAKRFNSPQSYLIDIRQCANDRLIRDSAKLVLRIHDDIFELISVLKPTCPLNPVRKSYPAMSKMAHVKIALIALKSINVNIVCLVRCKNVTKTEIIRKLFSDCKNFKIIFTRIDLCTRDYSLTSKHRRMCKKVVTKGSKKESKKVTNFLRYSHKHSSQLLQFVVTSNLHYLLVKYMQSEILPEHSHSMTKSNISHCASHLESSSISQKSFISSIVRDIVNSAMDSATMLNNSQISDMLDKLAYNEKCPLDMSRNMTNRLFGSYVPSDIYFLSCLSVVFSDKSIRHFSHKLDKTYSIYSNKFSHLTFPSSNVNSKSTHCIYSLSDFFDLAKQCMVYISLNSYVNIFGFCPDITSHPDKLFHTSANHLFFNSKLNDIGPLNENIFGNLQNFQKVNIAFEEMLAFVELRKKRDSVNLNYNHMLCYRNFIWPMFRNIDIFEKKMSLFPCFKTVYISSQKLVLVKPILLFRLISMNLPKSNFCRLSGIKIPFC